VKGRVRRGLKSGDRESAAKTGSVGSSGVDNSRMGHGIRLSHQQENLWALVQSGEEKYMDMKLASVKGEKKLNTSVRKKGGGGGGYEGKLCNT